MSTFPKSSPSESSDLDLVLIDRKNLYRGAVEHQIKLAFPASPFRLSMTIDASRKFAAERRRGEPVSIA
jgi:hypothetical protein